MKIDVLDFKELQQVIRALMAFHNTSSPIEVGKCTVYASESTIWVKLGNEQLIRATENASVVEVCHELVDFRRDLELYYTEVRILEATIKLEELKKEQANDEQRWATRNATPTCGS